MPHLLSTFSAICALVFSGCALWRGVSIAVARDGNDSVFDLRTRSINGLLGLRLWRTDTKEVLWDVNLNYYPGGQLRYGEIPTEFRTFNGALKRGRQNYPEGNRKPQPLPPSTTFMVELHYQFDTLLTAAGHSAWFLFSTDAGGALSGVTRAERITADDLPKAK